MPTFHGTNSLHIELFARDLHEARREADDRADPDADLSVTVPMHHEWERLPEKERVALRAVAKWVLENYQVRQKA